MASSAARKSNSSGRKGNSSAGRKKTQTAGKQKGKGTAKRAAAIHEEERAGTGIGLEISICVAAAISILIMLGNIGLGGMLGNIVRDALFGVFGLMAYVLPFVLFFGYAFFVANRENPLIGRKILGLILLFCFLCAFMQLLTLGYHKDTPIRDYYQIPSDDHTGGGFVGGIITFAFGYLFGNVGAYVLTVAGLVIASIILTQKPLITEFGSRSRNAARAASEKRRSSAAERQEKRLRKMKSKEIRRLRREAEEDEGEDYVDLDESYGLSPLEKVTLDKKKDSGKEKEKEKREKDKLLKSEQEKEKERIRKEKAFTPPPADPEHDAIFSMPSFLKDNEKRILPLDPSILPETEEWEKPLGEDPFDLEIRGIVPEEVPASGDRAGKNGRIAVGKGSAGSANGGRAAGGNAADNGRTAGRNYADNGRTAGRNYAEEMPSEAFAADDTTSGGGMPEGTSEGAGAEAARTRAKKQASPGSMDVSEIRQEMEQKAPVKPEYKLPPLKFLSKGKPIKGDSRQSLLETASKLQQTLQNFGVNVKVVNVSRGPTVTRYELQPEMGVKVSRIVNLQDDIKLNLATSEIRIEAPIPGKAAVGIEVPNKEIAPVMLRDIIDCDEFRETKARLPFSVGKDIGGKTVIADIEKMPHLLIAGATGSGKSVCINTLIMSILYACTPDDVRFLMIDPKVVELKIYDGIPHLLIPVVTDARKAAGALNWAVQEMTDRYNRFAQYPGVRDLHSYNERVKKMNRELDEAEKIPTMSRIIVIVDELADLMMVASSEVEDAICRLAQLARAAGIHLIIATQRPSVNVVTGLIKANMPSRIALAVTSGTDSRTILDMNGAEKLLGKGDMLFYPQGYPKPARVQGGYVSDEDITKVVEYLSSQSEDVEYNKEVEEKISSAAFSGGGGGSSASSDSENDGRDEYFADSGRLIIEKEKASIGMLQRAFKIGFNRAARVMDQLAEAGVVGGEEGTKPRKILMTMAEFEQLLSGETDSAS